MTATVARRLPFSSDPIDPVNLVWFAFSFSAALSILPMFVGNFPAPLSYVLTVIGTGGCGWLWLLSRALFRPEKPLERWALFVVAGIITIEGGSALIGHPTTGPMAEFAHILHNTESFICIGALVMVFAEAFRDYSADLSKPERRFRQSFGLTLAATIALTILWVLNAEEGTLGSQWREPIVLTSVLIGIIGTRTCIAFRKKHPLAQGRKSKSSVRFAGDDVLAKRITESLKKDRKFATPEFKVADLAELLDEHEYRVTQCITGALGYKNFNQMINSHRIDSAKAALANTRDKARPILSIAYDCGFNSIGPFNRAFKQQVGMTPREYRASVK